MKITLENISEVTAEITEAFKAIHYLDAILHRVAVMMQIDTSQQDGKSTPERIVWLARRIETRWQILMDHRLVLDDERVDRVLIHEKIIERLGYTVHNDVNHYVKMIKNGEYGKDVADAIYDDVIKQADAEKSNK